MGVLPDHEIRAFGEGGGIKPFSRSQVAPSSYDVRLGTVFQVYDNVGLAVDLAKPASYNGITHRKEASSQFILHPGEFVLGSTAEIFTIPDDLVGRLEGKSSLGRLGLTIHATAGYIDPGFHGSITLEMSNLLRVPIVLRPGFLIAQVSFMRMESPPEQPYAGHYQGDVEAAASRYGA